MVNSHFLALFTMRAHVSTSDDPLHWIARLKKLTLN